MYKKDVIPVVKDRSGLFGGLIALISGLVFYVAVRKQLGPFFIWSATRAYHNVFTGCLPSLIHGIAFTLFTIAIGVKPRYAAWLWILTGSLFEISQYIFPSLGTFDPLDLIANVIGAIIIAKVTRNAKRLYERSKGGRVIAVWTVGLLTCVATSRPPHLANRPMYYATAVDFSPDGLKVISGGDDKSLQLWDATSCEELKKFAGHGELVNSVAFSPNSSRIVSGSKDKTLKLWDAISGEALKTLAGHGDQVNGVAFSPDGLRIISGSDDKTLKVWDTTSGELLKTFINSYGYSGISIAFSPDGTRIVLGGGPLEIRDAASGDVLKTFSGR